MGVGVSNGSRPPVEAQAFKAVMARWATGVTVATSRLARAPVGMTVNSFASVSLQPPQVLICVNRRAKTHAAIVESGCFAVNLLAEDQQAWGMRFAGLQPEISDRFAGLAWFTARTGAPILPGGLGWFDCLLWHTFDSGDHTVFVGEVAASTVGDAESPLLYYNRNWRRLSE
jgi:flavin reductase (DIM6/NTAB) family NADH-FMN oxidoreductase RutF